MARAVALGEKRLVAGYTAAGFDVIPVEDEQAFVRQLLALARDPGIAMVFATEKLAALAPEACAQFRATSKAALLVVPGYEGASRAGFEAVRKVVERSLGVDILGKD